jgi:hypothetical protein
MEVPFTPTVEAARQLALDDIETEWVLFVDPDELVPAEFKSSLELSRLPSDVAGVRLRYETIAFGVTLSDHGAKVALVRADLARYTGDPRAHLPPVFNGRTVDASTAVPLIVHLSFTSVPQTMEKVLRYAESDPRGSETLDNPLKLPREIVSDIVVGRAWRDGRAAVVLVTINAIGRFYAAVLEWERRGYPDPQWRPWTRRCLEFGGLVLRLRMRLRGHRSIDKE